MNPSFVHLYTICQIARHGSYQAAAEQMNTTQPAVSARVRELENKLGIQLFQRRGRRMDLTLQGRELVRQSEPLLLALNDIILSITNMHNLSGTVRMGVNEIIAVSWFPDFIRAAQDTMPQVTFDVTVGLSIDIRSALEGGHIDLALVGNIAVPHPFVVHSIGDMDLIWAGSSSTVGHDHDASIMSWHEAVRTFPVWTLAVGSATDRVLRDAIASSRRDTRVNVINNVKSMVMLVRTGAGIGLLPRVLIEPLLASGELVALKDAPATPALSVDAVWHKDQSQVIIHELVRLAALASTFNRSSAKMSHRPKSGAHS